MHYFSPTGSQGRVETVAVKGGFSTVVRDHGGHMIEPGFGRGYFDVEREDAEVRHDQLVEGRLALIKAAEARADAGDD